MKRTMVLFYLSIGVAVVSGAAYQIFQKSIPPDHNPVVVLLVTYATAFLGTLVLFLIFPLHTSPLEALRTLTPANLLVGLTIIGIELGFLLAYRAGWAITAAPLVVNVSVALVLLPVGLLWFREQVNPVNLLGVVVCIVGLLMLNYRSG